MNIHFNYIFYFLEFSLLLFINNIYGKNVKTEADQYYLIYVDNKYGEVDLYTNSTTIQKRQESYNYVDSLLDKIHSLIIDNKDTYQHPKKIDEMEENSKLRKRDEDISNFDASELAFPVLSMREDLVIKAYLNEELAKIIESQKNVKSCVPNTVVAEFNGSNYNVEDILKKTHWKNMSAQEDAPKHLSVISQRQLNRNITTYDKNYYYYPSSAGKDTNIVIVDKDFYFNFADFKNDNERIAKCEAIVYLDKSVNNNVRHIDCITQKYLNENHGKAVASSAGGNENGVAKRANIYGIVLQIKDNGAIKSDSIYRAMQYIYDRFIKYEKKPNVIINLSFGGYFKSNLKGDVEYYNQMKSITKIITEEGGIIVASAGNYSKEVANNEEIKYLPCVLEDVICVGGINTDLAYQGHYEIDDNSNYGASVNFYAPYTVEHYIDDTHHWNRGTSTGTSFSSPIVAGIIATIIGDNPNITFTKNMICEHLQKTGIPFTNYINNTRQNGIFVNNFNIDYSKSTTTTTIPTTNTTTTTNS